MKIEVIKSFSGYKVGQVFDWGDGMCRILIGRGMVREIRSDEPSAEEAVIEQRTEKATIQPRRKAK